MESRSADDTLRKDVASGVGTLGYMHGFRSEIDLAEKEFRESIRLWESLARDRPNDPQPLRKLCKDQTNLGNFYSSHDRTADARAALLTARATARDIVKAHPDSAEDREALQEAEFYLGRFFSHVGEMTAAESSFRALLEAIDDLAKQRPSNLQLQFIRSTTLFQLGQHLQEIGRLNESDRTLAEATSALEKLVRENPTVVPYRRVLFRVHVYRGETCESIGQRDQAERHRTTALEIAEALVRDNPDVPDLQNEVAVALSGLSHVYYGSGRLEQATAVTRRAREIREKLARENPQTPHFQDVLAQTRHNQAVQSATPSDETIADLKKTIDVQRRLVRDHPEVVKFRFMLASEVNTLGGLSYKVQRYAEAETAFREAIAEWRELVRREPEVPRLKYELGRSLANLAGILTLRRQFDRAIPIQGEAIELLQRLVRDQPDVIDYMISLSAAEDMRASVARDTKDLPAARDGYGRSIRALESVLLRDPQNRQAKQFLLTNRNNRAVLMMQSGDHRGALQELDALTREQVTPAQRYNLGCAFSLLSRVVAGDASLGQPERVAQAEAHATRAVKLLTQVALADYLKPAVLVAQMKADSDLDPIRSRADYISLLKRIEAKANPNGSGKETTIPAR